MKKILLLITITLLLLSCDNSPKKEYTLVYKIYYPGNIQTYTVTNTEEYKWNSNQGTNYIYCNTNYIYRNSAPFEIISYTSKVIKQ